MKFTRSNFKEAQRRAKSMLDAFWEERQKNAQLKAKYDLLMEDYVQSLRDRVDFMQEIADSRIAEIDLEIERERSDAEYLSRESLEVRFKVCQYRQN